MHEGISSTVFRGVGSQEIKRIDALLAPASVPVRDGDTVGMICHHHGLSRETFLALNPGLPLVWTDEGVPTAELHVGEQVTVLAQSEAALADELARAVVSALKPALMQVAPEVADAAWKAALPQIKAAVPGILQDVLSNEGLQQAVRDSTDRAASSVRNGLVISTSVVVAAVAGSTWFLSRRAS
jgi:hypothetical protein